MPRRLQLDQKYVEAAEAEPANTAETVIGTLSGISTDGPTSSILVEASTSLTTGTGVTKVTLRIRRGTTTSGTLIGEPQETFVGESKPYGLSIQVVDNPGTEQASVSYVLTAEQTGGTGKGKAKGTTISATY